MEDLKYNPNVEIGEEKVVEIPPAEESASFCAYERSTPENIVKSLVCPEVSSVIHNGVQYFVLDNGRAPPIIAQIYNKHILLQNQLVPLEHLRHIITASEEMIDVKKENTPRYDIRSDFPTDFDTIKVVCHTAERSYIFRRIRLQQFCVLVDFVLKANIPPLVPQPSTKSSWFG